MKKILAPSPSIPANGSMLRTIKHWLVKRTPLICSLLLAALFIYAAYNKLSIYSQFVTQLAGSPILKNFDKAVPLLTASVDAVLLGFALYRPTRIKALWTAFFFLIAFTAYQYLVPGLFSTPLFEQVLAPLVTGGELLIALLLIWPPKWYFTHARLYGLWAAFFTMLAFSVYVYVLPHFFKAPGCSCGGIISQFDWEKHFYFNLAFTILAGLGVSFYPHSQKR